MRITSGRAAARTRDGDRRTCWRTTPWALVLALLVVAWGGRPGAAVAAGAGAGGRVWPLAGRPAVVRGWEPPATPYGRGHRGVDLAAVPGTEVLAAAPGRVSFAGGVAGRGVVSIEVAGTGDPPLRTTYEPVRPLVAKGDEVTAGQVVAVLEAGPFHCPSGCLHWGLRRADAYLDPLSLLPASLLRRGPSRLLPVFGVPLPEAASGARATTGSGGRPGTPGGGGPPGPAVLVVLAGRRRWRPGRRWPGRWPWPGRAVKAAVRTVAVARPGGGGSGPGGGGGRAGVSPGRPRRPGRR